MADVVLSNALEYEACRLLPTTIQADGETPVTPTCSCTQKRKTKEGEVEDDNNVQISKKQRTFHHHDAPSPGLSPFASIRPPEPLSINSILRQHCRKRLYVTPLHWKTHHLDLLGCRFHAKVEKGENTGHVEKAQGLQGQPKGQPPKGAQDQVSRNTINPPPHAIILQTSRILSSHPLASFQTKAMRDILEECGMTCDNSHLNFHFNCLPVDSLYTGGTFSRASHESEGPLLAVLSLRGLSVLRDSSIRPSHIKGIDSPRYNIRQKKLNNIRPVNEIEDPYIAALLMALAQEQQPQQDSAAAERVNTPNKAD